MFSKNQKQRSSESKFILFTEYRDANFAQLSALYRKSRKVSTRAYIYGTVLLLSHNSSLSHPCFLNKFPASDQIIRRLKRSHILVTVTQVSTLQTVWTLDSSPLYSTVTLQTSSRCLGVSRPRQFKISGDNHDASMMTRYRFQLKLFCQDEVAELLTSIPWA